MIDAAGVLLDDRSGVELGCHVVTGGADQLDSSLERLVVGQLMMSTYRLMYP
jgi:hypothetical protein